VAVLRVLAVLVVVVTQVVQAVVVLEQRIRVVMVAPV